jgi:hypothetical protein
MLSRTEIEKKLVEKVQTTKEVYKSAHVRFNAVSSEIPSGLPHPDGRDRIRMAGEEYYSAMADYNLALREFNTFLLDGTVPDYLKSGHSAEE